MRSMWLRLASNFHAKLFQRVFTLFIGFYLLFSGLLADEGGQPSLCSTAEFGIRCCGKQDLGPGTFYRKMGGDRLYAWPGSQHPSQLPESHGTTQVRSFVMQM